MSTTHHHGYVPRDWFAWSAWILAVLACPTLVEAQATSNPTIDFLPAWEGRGENHLVSSLPSTFTGINLNNFVGANTFYSAGYTGTRSVVANIEAGHIWTGHESLNNPGQVYNLNAGPTVSISTPGGEFDRHATWVGQTIGGRVTTVNPGEHQRGIAYGSTLYSGAIARNWTGSAYALSFQIDVSPFTNYGANLLTPYYQAMLTGVAANGNATADVVNSSWGFSAAYGGQSREARVIDALIRQTGKVVTFSAGNDGTANSIGGPGNGHNTIVVGAAGPGNGYNTVATFSSRSPSDIAVPNNNTVNTSSYTINPGGATRARVDIIAPGETMTLAFYGGLTGGNAASLGGVNIPGSNLYTGGAAGTSFAAPMVAGGAALLIDKGKDLALSNSTDTRVVKAVLLNSATKIPGWTNNTTGSGTGISPFLTTQALDYNSGAGRMNLTNAYAYYDSGATRDVPGLGGGVVNAIGYDFGRVTEGSFTSGNDYTFGAPWQAGSTATITLSWLSNRTVTGPVTNPQTLENNFSRLFLHVYQGTPGFETLIARSEAPFIATQHLHFTVPTTDNYFIRVNYSAENWDFIGNNQENYGLAWSVVLAAVPEPATGGLVALVGAGWFYIRRRQQRQAALRPATVA